MRKKAKWEGESPRSFRLNAFFNYHQDSLCDMRHVTYNLSPICSGNEGLGQYNLVSGYLQVD